MQKKLILITPSNVGGSEKMTILFSKLISTPDWEKKLYIVGPKYGLEKFIPDSSSYEYVNLRTSSLKFFLWLIKIIISEKPDIIFSSIFTLNARVILATLLFPNTKSVVRINNTFAVLSKTSRFVYKNLCSLADTIIAQTDEMRNEIINYCNLDPEKVKVINNPLDVELIDLKCDGTNPYSSSDEIRFLVVGRVVPAKGQDVAVRAFKLVRDQIPNAHLYFVGKYEDDSYYNLVSNLVTENKLNNCVHFLGYSDNPYLYMKFADCFVLSSRVEGLPNVLLEATYLKKRIVSTKCIPMIGRIIDEAGGTLCEVDDTIGLSTAMLNSIKSLAPQTKYKGTTSSEIIELFNTVLA